MESQLVCVCEHLPLSLPSSLPYPSSAIPSTNSFLVKSSRTLGGCFELPCNDEDSETGRIERGIPRGGHSDMHDSHGCVRRQNTVNGQNGFSAVGRR